MPKLSELQPTEEISLDRAFQWINDRYFDGFLDPPELIWNSRLRTCAGRFTPGKSKAPFLAMKPKIEIAQYLADLNQATLLVQDVLGHEMIHYWLWVRRRPYGHTPEFYSKLEEMGVSRYNPAPKKKRQSAYVYVCESCQTQFPSNKYHPTLACASCCQKHSQGKFDQQFQLALKRAPWLRPSANV